MGSCLRRKKRMVENDGSVPSNISNQLIQKHTTVGKTKINLNTLHTVKLHTRDINEVSRII